MKKILLLLGFIVGIALLLKQPPIKAENKQDSVEIEHPTINIDFDKINQEINQEVSSIKQDKAETARAIARLTKDNKALQNELIKLNNTEPKVDTVFIIKTDTITQTEKGKDYKTNIFGKKREIKNK